MSGLFESARARLLTGPEVDQPSGDRRMLPNLAEVVDLVGVQ